MKRLSKRTIANLTAGKLPEPTEDEVQSVIVAGLRAHGYLVQVTSRRAKKCPHCKEYSHQGDGASKGIADLLVRRTSWPRGLWLSLEVKKPGSIKWSSHEQRLLAEVGDVVVVQSLEEALRAGEEFSGAWQA